MPSNFPGGPDTIPNNVSNSTPEVDTHPGVHNQLADAVMAVENSLLPGGSMNLAAHVSASDPHPVYLTQPEGDARYALIGSGGGGTIPPGSITTTEIADGTIQPVDMAAGTAAANVGTLGGALTGTLPNPGLAALPANSVGSSQIIDGSVAATDMAAGAAATNVGTLGGVLTGTLPNPGLVPITSAMIADGTIQGADIATGTITTTQIQDGTIATADLANAAVTNAKLGTDTARLNLLTNGGFEIWQRGNGPFTAAGAWTADRWQTGLAGTDTLSIQRSTTTSNSAYSAQATFTLGTGAGGTYLIEQLRKADGVIPCGQPVSLSIRVNASAANAVRISVGSDGTGGAGVYSSFHPGGSTWATLTATQTIPSDATFISIVIWFAASCTAYLDNAMLVVGSVAADYAPLHPADDLARCLRYYERHGFATPWPRLIGYAAAAGAYANACMLFAAEKAVTPTMTLVGTWAITNMAAQPGASEGNVAGYNLRGQSSAVGSYDCYPSTSAMGITAEANP